MNSSGSEQVEHHVRVALVRFADHQQDVRAATNTAATDVTTRPGGCAGGVSTPHVIKSALKSTNLASSGGSGSTDSGFAGSSYADYNEGQFRSFPFHSVSQPHPSALVRFRP